VRTGDTLSNMATRNLPHRTININHIQPNTAQLMILLRRISYIVSFKTCFGSSYEPSSG
jgi:hypothetical protein